MRVLVFPKDVNPYQELLYSEMRKLGVKVTYLGRLTPLHGLSIFLIPLESIVRRIFGARLIHIHWVAPFCLLPKRQNILAVRWISQVWFELWLWIAPLSGIHLVWTAHNVLPHDPAFVDDIAMRRSLAAASDLVIAHSTETLSGLRGIGAVPRRVAVIPHGPFASVQPSGINQTNSEFFRFLFIGRIKPYKGVEDLLGAFASIPITSKVHLTIAGQCIDQNLLARLQAFAGHPNVSMAVGPERFSDAEMSRLLLEAHVVVLPFRAVTTSGSAILAISHGKPIIIPETASMIDVPDSAAIRYDGTVSGLAKALEHTASMSTSELSAMSEAASMHAHTVSWAEIAVRTKAALEVM